MTSITDEPVALSESEIVSGLKSGERNAWRALYEKYSVRVWRYVARLIGKDAAAVADVTQETFMEAARSARRFDPSKGTLASWLFGIAHRQTAAYRKKVARNYDVASRERERTKVMPGSSHDDPVHVLETIERNDLVRTILAEMRADDSLLLMARHLDGLSITEIQTTYGGSSNAIRSRLTRARQSFRDIYERSYGETASAGDGIQSRS